jgi:WD40 repeat protein
VREWEVSTGSLRRTLTPENVAHGTFAYCPRSNRVATHTAEGVFLWDLASGKVVAGPLPCNHALAFSPDGSVLADCQGNVVALRDMTARRAGPPLIGRGGRATRIAFFPDGKTLASLSSEGVVGLWSARTGQELLSLEDHRGPIRWLAISPDGRTLATYCEREGSEGEVYLWLIPDEPRPADPGATGAAGAAR